MRSFVGLFTKWRNIRQAKSVCKPSSLKKKKHFKGTSISYHWLWVDQPPGNSMAPNLEMSSLLKVSPGIKPRFFNQKIEAKEPEKNIPWFQTIDLSWAERKRQQWPQRWRRQRSSLHRRSSWRWSTSKPTRPSSSLPAPWVAPPSEFDSRGIKAQLKKDKGKTSKNDWHNPRGIKVWIQEWKQERSSLPFQLHWTDAPSPPSPGDEPQIYNHTWIYLHSTIESESEKPQIYNHTCICLHSPIIKTIPRIWNTFM